jgi:hypothetical protein
LILAAVPCFAQTAGAPTYLNAEVIRIDRAAGSATLRSESGDVLLTADVRVLEALMDVRRGDKVLVAYETMADQSGRTRRVVTYARATSPTSGEPAPVPRVAMATATVPAPDVRATGATLVRPALLTSGAAGIVTVSNAPGIVGPESPYARTVPNIPQPIPVFNAVLPTAAATDALTDEDVGTQRAVAERDFDAAALVLAAHANEVDGAWQRLKNACLPGFVPASSPDREWFLLMQGSVPTPADDQCRTMYTNTLAMAATWERQLGIALDAARHADVLPGRTRETLSRHRIDR